MIVKINSLIFIHIVVKERLLASFYLTSNENTKYFEYKI